MENTLILSTIAGIVIPFALALLRRYVTLNEMATYAVSFGICFVLTLLMRAYQVNFDWKIVLSDFGTMYAISQAVYGLITKPTGINDKIENVQK